MTLITLQDGKLVLRDGKVGTGAACCCGASGCCCVAGNPDSASTTQEECEACETSFMCGDFVDGEQVVYPVDDCSECPGFCYDETTGPCGIWIPNHDCNNRYINCSGVESVWLSGWPDRIPGTAPNGLEPFADLGGDKWHHASYNGALAQEMFLRNFGTEFLYSDSLTLFTLKQSCGRWFLSLFRSETNLVALHSYLFNAYGPDVEPGGCGPYGEYSGLWYWNATELDPQTMNEIGPISGSLSVTLTITENHP